MEQQEATLEPLAVTITKAAQLLSLGRSTLYPYVKAGIVRTIPGRQRPACSDGRSSSDRTRRTPSPAAKQSRVTTARRCDLGRDRQKGRRNHRGFSMLFHDYFTSAEYAAVSPRAVKALLDIYCQFRGSNNGDLCAAWTIMSKRGWTSKDQLDKALRELLEQAGSSSRAWAAIESHDCTQSRSSASIPAMESSMWPRMRCPLTSGGSATDRTRS